MEKIKEVTPGELMDLCVKLNCDDFHVWCDFSGHVDSISIRIQPGGYKDGVDSLYICANGSCIIPYCTYLDKDLVEVSLDEIKASLLREYTKHTNKR